MTKKEKALVGEARDAMTKYDEFENTYKIYVSKKEEKREAFVKSNSFDKRFAIGGKTLRVFVRLYIVQKDGAIYYDKERRIEIDGFKVPGRVQGWRLVHAWELEAEK